MKNTIYFYLLILSIPFFNSCEKKVLLKPTDEFIEAKFGDEFIRYTSTLPNPFNNQYYNDTVEYMINGIPTKIVQDQLNLLRHSDNGRKSIEIYILQSELTKDQIPINLPHKTTCSVELQLRDYDSNVQSTFGPSDDVNYKGHVQLTIESWDDNNYLEGNFSGNISTSTGKGLNVSEGKFRVQIFY